MDNSHTLLKEHGLTRLRVIKQAFLNLETRWAAKILGLPVWQVFRLKARVNSLDAKGAGHAIVDANRPTQPANISMYSTPPCDSE